MYFPRMTPRRESDKEILDGHSEGALSDSDPECLLDECRSLYADILEEEEVIKKKRRWLMGLAIGDKRGQKMQKTSNFFRDSCLPESYVRNDDLALENVRDLVSSAFKSCIDSRTSQCFNHDEKTLNIDDPPDSPAQSHDENRFERMKMLSRIIINSGNSNSAASSSVGKLINLLDVLPSQALVAMNRKLKNETVVPQFAFPFSCKRSFLIKRLKKICEKFLSEIKPGWQLAVPLAKALSVICLAVKVKMRRADFLTSKLTFFHFDEEVVALQNEIIEAIWAIPGLRPKTWKQLHGLFSPDVDFSLRSFRKSFNNYMMECLFHCDDLQLPGQLKIALKIVNRKIQSQVSSVKSEEEEIERVLHVSSQLRRIISESLTDCDVDQEYERYVKGLGTKDVSTIRIIDMDCSLFAIQDSAKISLSFSDQVEGSGDSMPDEPHLIIDDQKEDSGSLNSCPKNWYKELVTICDDASLIAYKIIGELLDGFMCQENSDLKGISAAIAGIIGGPASPLPTSIGEKIDELLESLSYIVSAPAEHVLCD